MYKLIKDLELGDFEPSQLLRKIQGSAGGKRY